MKATAGWNLTIVGAWNANILTPNWIADKIIKKAEVRYEVFFDVINPQNRRRISFKDQGFSFEMLPGRVTFSPLSTKKGDLQSTENIAREILKILCHTPINGMGFNFNFEDEDNDFLDAIVVFKDNEGFHELGGEISGHEIQRTIKGLEIPGSPELNLKISATPEARHKISFNYHHEVKEAEKAISLLTGDAMFDLSNHAKKVLEMYSDDFEEETDDD